MKVLRFISSICFLVTSCVLEPTPDKVSDINVSLTTKSDNYLSDAIYSKEIQSWIIPGVDPYELSNFRYALSLISESEVSDLSPTHYAVTVYPRSEEEQSKIELDSELKVSYIPFCYHRLPRFLSDSLDTTIGRQSKELVIPSKYHERYIVQNIDGSTSEYSIPISTLFVVWPISRPFPEDLDYSIDYEVFLPYKAETCNQTVLSKAEIKSIEQFIYHYSDTPRECTRRIACGTIVNQDDLLDSILAMVNLKIRFQLGSSIIDTNTDQNGYFSATIPDSYSMSCLYSQSKWKITELNSTSPIEKYLINVNGWGNGATYILSENEASVHRASAFYFGESHPIEVPNSNIVLRIRMTRTYEDWRGSFTPPMIGTPYIRISNNASFNTGAMFATVCHELGHYTHYYYKNNWLWYVSLNSIIAESYASYISWRISHYYYNSVRELDNRMSSWDAIFGQSHQSWKKTDESSYSPMFVDLYDDYNQGLNNSVYNFDSISFLPNSIIKSLATNNSNWAQIKSQLQGYIGLYFSQSDYNQYVAPYDYYLSHN